MLRASLYIKAPGCRCYVRARPVVLRSNCDLTPTCCYKFVASLVLRVHVSLKKRGCTREFTLYPPLFPRASLRLDVSGINNVRSFAGMMLHSTRIVSEYRLPLHTCNWVLLLHV